MKQIKKRTFVFRLLSLIVILIISTSGINTIAQNNEIEFEVESEKISIDNQTKL
jgi:hypothetical protein